MFIAQAFDGIEWIPFILFLLGLGTLFGLTGLLVRLFSITFSGQTFSSWAIGTGIALILLILLVLDGPQPVVYLVAATPIALGVSTRIIPRKKAARGFPVSKLDRDDL
jgi:hypothetical protein